jgi:hypothetical protein
MPSTDYLSFDTNGVERMSIDSTGTVSIPGTLRIGGGSVRSPSFKFENGTNTGMSSPSANTLSFDVNGIERMNIDSTDVTVTATLVAAAPLLLTNVLCEQAILTSAVTIPALATTSIIFLDKSNTTAVTITFPPNPMQGQLFTIMTRSTSTFTVTNSPGAGATAISTPITTLNAALTPLATTLGAAATYIFIGTVWYRLFRG